MIFAVMCLLALASSANVFYLRATIDRRLRWQLYAVRDELRWAAVQDRSVLDSRHFWLLDRTLTRQCEDLDEVSLWSMLPLAFATKERARVNARAEEFENEMKLPENELFSSIFKKSAALFTTHLLWRHAVLVVLISITILSAVPIVLLEYVWEDLENQPAPEPVVQGLNLPEDPWCPGAQDPEKNHLTND